MELYKKITLYVVLFLLFNCGSNFTQQEQIRVYNYYIKKANSFNDIQNYKASIAHCNLAIQVTDTLSIAFKTKGIALYNLNFLDDALENFNKAISLEGETSEILKNRALVHLKNKDSYFLKDIETYLNHHPNDEEAIMLRRDYYENISNYVSEIGFRSIKY